MNSLKESKTLTYKDSIQKQVQEIKEKDLKEAKKLSEKTTPGFASFLTGVPKEEITGEANKKTEKKIQDAEKQALLQKLSCELYEVDNGYVAKATNKQAARKLHGFSDDKVREILRFREKQKQFRVKKQETGFLTSAYTSFRNYLQPERVEEEKLIKRENAREKRDAIRQKWGIK